MKPLLISRKEGFSSCYPTVCGSPTCRSEYRETLVLIFDFMLEMGFLVHCCIGQLSWPETSRILFCSSHHEIQDHQSSVRYCPSTVSLQVIDTDLGKTWRSDNIIFWNNWRSNIAGGDLKWYTTFYNILQKCLARLSTHAIWCCERLLRISSGWLNISGHTKVPDAQGSLRPSVERPQTVAY